MAYPRYLRSETHKFNNDTSGDVTLNSTSWAIAHASRFRLTLAECQEGDVLYASVNLSVESQATDLFFDFATVVSSAIENRFAGTTSGVASLYCATSAYQWKEGGIGYTITADDIVGGSVEVALAYKTTSATNRTLRSSAGAYPVAFSVMNLGPAQG